MQTIDKEVEVENVPKELIIELDRGKLILPTKYPVVATSIVWFCLQKFLDSCAGVFISGQHQLNILNQISISKLDDYFVHQENIIEKCNCNRSLQGILESICHRTCKVLLNNLVKNTNDELVAQSSSGTKRKVNKLN
jgi:hypothetical protein